jgi:succinoglycan biosynthesis protein ExoA
LIISDANLKKVSIIIPCRNEKSHIGATISSILAQERCADGFEIIIADGGSDDGTREILDRISKINPVIRIIDNPERIVSTGLNAAIRAAQGDIIVRMDAHTEFSPDYVKQCVQVLQATGSDNVGGPWFAVGRTFLQKAIALAFQSPFSAGGAGSHRVDYEGPVDTVYLGCWRKATLMQLGLFDEELVRNQDDELNLRIIRAGGTVWQSPSIRSWYYPRASIVALYKQYMQYGYWKVRVIQKHRIPASIRHLVPGGFVGVLLGLCLLSLGLSSARMALTMLVIMYLVANLSASLSTCRMPINWAYLPAMPLVFSAYHFGYGWGFLRGVLDFMLLNKSGRRSYGQLTR